MPLPPKLTSAQLASAISYVEKRAQDPAFVMLYHEQANVFSAVVGILATLALDALSPYEKNPNKYTSASKFPDLILRGTPRSAPPPPSASLEMKASKRPWEVDAHYNHEGWFMIWRYAHDPTQKHGKQVVIWRVDCAYLTKAAWRLQRSTPGASTAGHEETYSVVNPSTVFKTATVFALPGVRLSHGKPIL